MNSKSLRRSYRWRLQLGIWKLPNQSGDPVVGTAADKPNEKQSEEDPDSTFSLQPQRPKSDMQDSSSLSNEPSPPSIWNHNQEQIQTQRTAYCALLEKHRADLEQNHHVADDDEGNEGNHPDETELDKLKQQAPLLDPLTAMVMEQEEKQKRLQELDLKYRKERARRKRGGTAASHTSVGSEASSDRFDTYSSYQTLEIIHKDLHRLPPDHHTYHHSRKNLKRYQSQSDINGTTVPPNGSNTTPSTGNKDDSLFEASVQERTDALSQLLLLYAKEYPLLGYRQGMHEIASYLLMVLEMDLFDIETEENTESSATTLGLEKLTLADAANKTTNPEHYLLGADFLLHDAYDMFVCIMDQLSPAYDVRRTSASATASTSAFKSPMEQMAQSIVRIIPNIALDRVLHQHLVSLHCPPELYCTRWVRLMLSREVVGWRNVLLLWDIFLDCTSQNNTIYSMPQDWYSPRNVSPKLKLGSLTLMQVLEATAASRILLCREQLLQHSENGDVNESIHTLMNMAPLGNIRPLTAILLSLLRRMQMQEGGIDLSTVSSPLSVPSSADASDSTSDASSRLSSLGQQMARDAVSLSSRARDALQQAGKKLVYSKPNGGEGVDHGNTAPAGPTRSKRRSSRQQQTSVPPQQLNGGDPLMGLAANGSPLHEKEIVRTENVVYTTTTRRAENGATATAASSASDLLGAPEAPSELFSMSSPLPSVRSMPATGEADLLSETTSSNAADSNTDDPQGAESTDRVPLAETLDQCIAVIQDFFQTLPAQHKLPAPLQHSSAGAVPENVWEALAKIDSVRRQLLEEL